ncbi:M23 family metallopeptidase [Stenotrophomonas pavanii]|uniref:M23 family metallopeptidase n=1 Tax=Stenotrophomonas pavanii TaxID=487698 RepID=UPI0040413D7A
MTLLPRLFAVLVVSFSALTGAAAATDPRQQGATLTAQFYEGHIDALWERMTPQMRAGLQSPQNLVALREQVLAGWGAETELVSEKVEKAEGYDTYLRQARFAKSQAIIQVLWAIDADGRIAGFYIRPLQTTPPQAAASGFLDYQTRTRLQLPFKDEFFVFWGGRSVEQNYHAAHAGQRFAMDLLVVRDGRSHGGEGQRNEDYFCFGRPILAPADGTVVEVVEGVADNVPGQMNAAQLTGNRVILDHGNDEYSVLAHLRQGSVRVAQGQVVRSGTHLGDCGNSGNSSEPHLHYQLQAGPAFGVSAALPAQFSGYVADGKPVARGEPVKGQHIRPGGAAHIE